MRFKKKSSQQDYSSYGYGAAYEPTEVLPQTEALRQYRLNKDDLKPLRVKLATNPVDPRYAPMKLYRVADLQRVCDAKYAADGGLDAYREKAAERKLARDEAETEKQLGKATRAAELVKFLTEFGVGKQEREQLLAQDCAAKFIKRARSKATAFDVATELVAMRGGAGAAAASSAPMPSQGQMVEQLAMAQRASDLVAALTEAGVLKKERERLLAQPSAVMFIKRSKSNGETAADVANELVAMRGAHGGAAAAAAAPVMSTPAKAAPRRAPAASPIKLERDPEVVHL